MRLLVTGGLGCIGSHVIEAAVRSGHDVRVLDNRTIEEAATEPDCAAIATVMSGIDFRHADVRDSRWSRCYCLNTPNYTPPRIQAKGSR